MKTDMSVFILALAAMPLGCGVDMSSDGEVCSSDQACKGDRICEDGVCTSPMGPGSITGEDGGQRPLTDGGPKPEGMDLSDQGEESAVTAMQGPPGSSARELELDAGMPADNGWGEEGEEEEETEPQSTAEQVDAGAGDGSNVWAEPVSTDPVLPFPVGECTAGFECVRQPIASMMEGGDGFCVRPGGLAPPSCETDSDCAELNVGCFDFAEHLPEPPDESMGLRMKWCVLACDGQAIDGGASDDPDGAVEPGEGEGDELCSNTCSFANDGQCDDCGPGSDYSVCDLGTDCGDCGPRDATDSCVSGDESGSTSTCHCSCYCSGCTTETTRTCTGINNTSCLSCAVVCQDVCTTDVQCGSYLSSSGSCY